MIALIYTGGGAYLPNVPAKDLTDEDIERLGLDEKELLGSGLYKKPAKKTKKKQDGE